MMKTVSILLCMAAAGLSAAQHTLDTFERQQLSDVYFSEGASAGDINGDGVVDLVYGPYWFAGPKFKDKHEIYPVKPQPRQQYADNFFTWLYDFDGDGWKDMLVVGLPGTPAYLYQHPGGDHLDQHWKKHQVFDSVSNESPHFTNLVGDGKPELTCTRKGVFGFVTVDWNNPFAEWTFHQISDRATAVRFGHGLGVGDVNADGLLDILHAGGWFEQPRTNATEGSWKHHAHKFSNSYGGAEMYAYDVDGDGDNDVITSLAAHDFGLAWYEQHTSNGKTSFSEHIIMGARPEQNRYGLVFSEPHSVALSDIDGDGLNDIVTGKTYYSHHEKSPLWNAGAVVYWFRLVRNSDGVDWVPYRADGEAGIGRQINIIDVNSDQIPDIVVGGMKGGNVLIHRREKVSEERWKEAQPTYYEGKVVRSDRGKPVALDEKTGRVNGAIEGESMKVIRVSTGEVGTQKMDGFKSDRWSDGKQLFWSNAKPRARLVLEFDVPTTTTYDIGANFTIAKDYAIINVLLDNKALGEPLDLFSYPDVRTTGLLQLDQRTLEAGKHQLTLETIGANESAIKAYMVGFDYLRLTPQ